MPSRIDDAAHEPRFYVREFTGFPINMAWGKSGGTEKMSCYIIDRLYNCRVVETWETNSEPYLHTRALVRRKAMMRAAQLNHWWDLETAR